MAISASPPPSTKVHVLENDGVVSQIYTHIFKMQKALRTSSSVAAGDGQKRLIGFPIPDTVVYDNNFPQAWFSYDRKLGEMIKLPGKQLDAKQIFKVFSHAPSGCGGICAQFACVKRDDETGQQSVVITYFAPPELDDWLHGRNNWQDFKKEGVLQRFIAPRGEHNEAMEAVWSPHVTKFSRRANKHRLESRHIDMRNKAATFDAQPHLYIETLANEQTQEKVVGMVKAVAERLLVAEHKVVSRLSGLFKQDRDGDVWFMFATSLRIETDTLIGATQQRDPLDLTPLFQQPPSSCTTEEIVRAEAVEDQWVDRDPTRVYRPKQSHRHSPRTLGNGDTDADAAAVHDKHEAEVEPDLEFADQMPDEVKLLNEYIEDTLYALYANQLTLRGRGQVAVQLPPVLANFLGATEAQRLMCSILDLQVAQHLGPGIFVSHGRSQRPWSSVKAECDEFLQQFRIGFE